MSTHPTSAPPAKPQADQLDVQVYLETTETRSQFEDAKNRAAQWVPRPTPDLERITQR